MRSGPSLTARIVALARSRLERPQTPEGDPGTESRLYADLRLPTWWWTDPGVRRWIAARTRFFDQATLAAIDAGITQIVIVGAGYDGRALRFGGSGIHFFELDQAITQRDKRRRLEALGVAPDAVTFIAHDLTRGDLAGVMAAAGHVEDRATLYICEGLLIYLEPQVGEELLGSLRDRAAPGSRLALSAHEHQLKASALARFRSGVQLLVLAAIGEPRRSVFGPGELESSEGCVGNFEKTAPQPGSVPKPINPGQPSWACKNLVPGLLIDGTVTNESMSTSTGGGSTGTSGSSHPPSAELTKKVFLTKTPNAMNAPEMCFAPPMGTSIVNVCEGGVTFGPLQSVFSTASSANASAKPKHAQPYGHATFKIPAGKTEDVRIPLTSKARKLLMAKGKLRGKAITVLVLPNGEKVTTTRDITVKLSRSRHHG